MAIANGRWAALAAAVLLAGCSGSTGALFPPTNEEAQAAPIPEAPGVTLAIVVTGGGDRLRIHAEASNRGQGSYLVPNACAGATGAEPRDLAPFTMAARPSTGPSQELPIYPARACAEASMTEFLPRQTMEFEVEWDGTFWSAASNGQDVVRPGPHVIEVVLQLYVGPDAEHRPMVAQVLVKVLDV